MAAKTAAELVAAAKARIEEVSARELAAEMSTGDPVIIDLREPEERQRTGAIPGAVSAVRGMLEFVADPASPYHKPEFDPNRRTVLYCASGGRSALATATLQDMGYTNVAHLAGGVKAWGEAGQELEKVD